jgi:hypothetical protein
LSILGQVGQNCGLKRAKARNWLCDKSVRACREHRRFYICIATGAKDDINPRCSGRAALNQVQARPIRQTNINDQNGWPVNAKMFCRML